MSGYGDNLCMVLLVSRVMMHCCRVPLVGARDNQKWAHHLAAQSLNTHFLKLSSAGVRHKHWRGPASVLQAHSSVGKACTKPQGIKRRAHRAHALELQLLPSVFARCSDLNHVAATYTFGLTLRSLQL